MSICFLCRRSTVKSASRYSFQFNERARPARLKPVAFCLKGRCSIQQSAWRNGLSTHTSHTSIRSATGQCQRPSSQTSPRTGNRNYRTHIWKQLVPFFGEYSMKDLNPEMIQQFVSTSVVSPKTTKNICIALQSMWTTARAWGYVAHDLMEGVVLPEVKRVQRFFLSQREIQLILARAQEPHRTWYGLAAETGLRAGELCGLTVDDLDIERGMLQVRQSAWRGKLGDPKTDDSIRVVELSPQACAHLKTFLKSWHPNERRLLFATCNGTPWDQNLLLKRRFRPLLRPLGIQVPAAMASTPSVMRMEL